MFGKTEIEKNIGSVFKDGLKNEQAKIDKINERFADAVDQLDNISRQIVKAKNDCQAKMISEEEENQISELLTEKRRQYLDIISKMIKTKIVAECEIIKYEEIERIWDEELKNLKGYGS